MPIMPFTVVYIGLLAITAGHIFTTQGAAHLSIQCKPQDCKIAEMVGNPELDGLILRPPFRFFHVVCVKSLHNCSLPRVYHTAWTPPSLPDTIVLLGGACGDGELGCRESLTAEIWSGIKD